MKIRVGPTNNLIFQQPTDRGRSAQVNVGPSGGGFVGFSYAQANAARLQANTARDTANDAYGQANGAYQQANSARDQANTAYFQANDAYLQANTGYAQANDARDQANTALDTANGAYSQANGSYAHANIIYAQSNSSYTQANDAYAQANSARDQANTGRDQANTAYGQANAAYSEANLKLDIAGGTITGNLVISGNLEVLGNSTILNVESLIVEDNELILNGNVSGSPITNAYITINRGIQPNTSLRWNEGFLRWEWTDDGSTYYPFNLIFDSYSAANAAVLRSGDTMTGNLNVDATLITQNIIPALNETFDIGSPTQRFKDLYLGGNSLYIGNTIISDIGGNVVTDTFVALSAIYVGDTDVLEFANVARTTANNAYDQANAARSQANAGYNAANTGIFYATSAYAQANDARDQANTGYLQANNARDQANVARVTANDAYGQANDAYGQANTARDQANTARIIANTAYFQANTARTTANDAYGVANTATEQANVARDQANTARDIANSSYESSNTVSSTANSALSTATLAYSTVLFTYADANLALETANTSYAQANDAYAQANAARDLGNTAYGQANDAYSQANSARDQANTGYAQANAARDQANTGYEQANNARLQANTAYGQANDAYLQANSARDQANTARDFANGAYAQANGAYAQANGAYAQANGAYAQANDAFAQANGAYAQANGAYAHANLVYDQANTARLQANTAYAQANAAYDDANTRVLKSGDAMTGNLLISVNDTSDALRITQLGSGNVFVAEDSSNPDFSPFIVRNTGNVGVGNWDPQFPLDVTGTLRLTGNLNIGEYGRVLYYDPVVERTTISNYNLNGSVVLESGGGNKYALWADPNGNVGISGITAPTSNLHVLGNANITTSINTATLNATTINAATIFTYDGINVSAVAINAYAQANVGRQTANDAYEQANAALSSSGGVVTGDLQITGNLLVSGNSTIFDTEILSVEDADIVLLSNVTSTPALNAGIIVNRGLSSNTFLRWSETSGQWGWSDDGTNFYAFDSALDGYAQANAARLQANTGRQQANDARDQANTARDVANGAYGQANGAYAQANGAYAQANGAYNQANGAYSQANGAYNQANGAYTQANGAYSQANVAANTVRVYANSDGILSNKFLNFVNTLSILVSVTDNLDGNANIAFSTAGASVVDAYTQANAAYDQANAARGQANTGYAQANDARGQANTAYGQANAAYAQANGAYAHANIVYAHANNVYDQANAARSQANTARNQANTGYFQANAARDQANTARGTANDAYGQANNAYAQANAAYADSNTRVLRSGDNMTGNLSISVNNTNDALRITQLGSGNAFVVEDSTNPDATPFVITATGNVGIGNTAPEQKLEVEGSIRFSGDLYMRDYGKIVYYNPTSERLTIANYNANGSVVVESGGGKYGFWSDPNANIGLSGITAPTSNLHVLGNANITAGINTTTINVATGNVTANLFVAESSYSNNFMSTRTALSAPSTSGFHGERLRLYDFNQAGRPNYAIGVEGNHIWMGVDDNGGTTGFKWYGNTTQVALLRTNSTFEVSNTVAAKIFRANGTGTAIDASQGNILTNRVTGTEFAFLNGLYTVTVRGGTVQTNDYTFRLPANGGTDGFVLVTNGSGDTSWSNSIYVLTNTVYAQANTAYGQANDAYLQANNARLQANDARDQANTAYATANLKIASLAVSGNGLAVSNITTANINDYTISVNTASTSLRGTTLLIDSTSSTDTGNAATANAVNATYEFANTKLPLAGGTISGDLIISGNLYLSQNTTLINVSTYQVEDPLIYLASNNKLTDSVDIGFVGGKNTGGTYSHTGLVRHAGDQKYYLFDNLPDEAHVNNVINVSSLTLATLKANLEGNSITLMGNTVATHANLILAYTQANDAYAQANSARGQANTGYAQANDAYLQANSARDQANTARGTANDAYSQANSARDQANTGYAQANDAYLQANTARDQANTARTTANDAYAQANSARDQANTGYAQANDAYSQANTARDQANTARDTANGAYAQANGAYSQANGAYAQANGAYAHANIVYAHANNSYDQANSARDQANTARDTANGAYAQANGAYSQANGAYAQANGAYAHANIVYAHANNSYDQANNARDQANTARGTANDSYAQANSARDQANTGYAQANDAYAQANTARAVANDAYGQANTARDTANGAYAQANGAYAQANGAYAQANGAYAQANLAYGQANDAYGQANTARGTANDAYGQANAAYLQANNAYAEANLKLNIAGGTITGSLLVQGNLEVLGNSTTLNVETLLIEDNEIILNSNVTSTPSLDAFLTINRGNTPNVSLKWDENLNVWRWTDDGTNFYSFNSALDSYAQANSARDQANTARGTANDSYAQANNAYATANGAYGQANGAYAQANGAYAQANGAYEQANGAYGQANGAYAQANGAYGQANAAYGQANGAYSQANGAYAQANVAANTVRVYANSGSELSNKFLNFVNTASVQVTVSDNLDGNANISFTTTGAAVADAYAQANAAYDKANSAAITVKEIYASNSTVINSFSNISTIQFDTESGMAVVNNSSNTVTIKLNSTFKYWNINGSPGLEAFGLDTVNFIPTDGLELTANNSNTPKSLILSAPGIANNVANAANTVSISSNSGGTLYAKKINFVNTANIAVVVSDSGDGNANISLVTTFTGAAGLMISDRFTGTGACTVFALTQSSTNDRTFVFLNGVSQKPAVDFTVNNAQLTMNVAPANNTVLEVRTFSEINLTDVTKIYSDTFTGDGTSNTFTLTESGSTVRTLVHIDGVTQRPTADYAVVGKTLTFTTPPLANTIIETRTFNTVAIGNVSSIQSDVFNGTGACTTFALSKSTITKGAFVFIDGIVQVPTTDYNVSNNVIVFTEAPEANAVVEVRSISDLNLGESGTEIANGSHKFALTSKGAFFTNNGFSTETDSIARTYILRGTTTNATESELFYNTSMRIPVAANTTVFYTADVVARRTDATGESAAFQIKGVADNFSGTVADVGDMYELVVAEDDSGLSVDARADDSNNSINIYVTGSAGKTIRWTALVNTVEVAQ